MLFFDLFLFSISRVRKDHVIREIQSQKKWTEQWGYLLEEYEKVNIYFLSLLFYEIKDSFPISYPISQLYFGEI